MDLSQEITLQRGAIGGYQLGLAAYSEHHARGRLPCGDYPVYSGRDDDFSSCLVHDQAGFGGCCALNRAS
jgi:hypothetical protein